MKRSLSLLLAAILLLLSACVKPAEPENQAHFYYRISEPDYVHEKNLIDWEPRDITETENDLQSILQLYFNGPLDSSLLSPFPKNLTLEQLRWVGDTLLLKLSSNFAALSGVNLSVACACITKTCLELTEAKAVQFIAAGSSLNGKANITMNADNLLFFDNSLEQLRRNVTLYYTDTDYRFLIPQAGVVEQTDLEETCIQMVTMLLNAPDKLTSPLPSGTRVLDISISRNVCTINLSNAFEDNRPSLRTAQRMALLSITNTLTQLDGIDAVEFAVNGTRLFHYGAISTSTSFTAEEAAIGPIRIGMNEHDVTIYMSSVSGDKLLPIPMAVRWATGSILAEQTMNTLLNATSGNGWVNPIPSGTTFEDLRVEDNCCYITIGGSLLTKDFAAAETAVRAIVSTLCSISDIQTVRLSPASDYNSSLFSLFNQEISPSASWFA